MTGESLIAAKALELVDDKLTRREQQIISEVCGKVTAGDVLDPQYALQKWLALAAINQLRRGLKHEGRPPGGKSDA